MAKVNVAKGKLELLCRELQKQNKLVVVCILTPPEAPTCFYRSISCHSRKAVVLLMKKTRNGWLCCAIVFQQLLMIVSVSRELSTQFQKTIEEVSAKMDQQGKDYVASLRENER